MNEGEADMPDDEHPEVEAILVSEKPVPRAAFRGELRRALLSSPLASRPPRLRLLIGACATSGLALLLVAVVGVAGAGPLAA